MRDSHQAAVQAGGGSLEKRVTRIVCGMLDRHPANRCERGDVDPLDINRKTKRCRKTPAESFVSIGRLDLNSEGLLLLTNDGALARRLELPATGWVRRYRVRVHGAVEPARLAALARGIRIDGIAYGPIRAQLDRQQGSNAWVTLSLQEGKNREVRRVLEHLGYPVTRLIRLAYGPFQLGHLARGAIEEVPRKVLQEQLGKGEPVRTRTAPHPPVAARRVPPSPR